MRIGDAIKLLQAGTLSPGDEAVLVDRLNTIDRQMGILQGWIAPAGNDPNFGNMTAKSGYFETLPHECGSLHGVAGGDITVPTTSWTTIQGASGGATWDKGLRIDAATGRIYVQNVPVNSVLMIVCYLTWQGDMHGEKVDFKWVADDGSAVVKEDVIPAGTTGNYQQFLSHARRTPAAETYYYLQAAQYAGVDRHVVDCNFVVMRVR